MLLSAAIDELIIATRSAGRSLRTSDGYRRYLGYFLEFIGDRDVAAISPTELRRYSVFLQERERRYENHPSTSVQNGGLAPDSVISYLRPVKRLFNWLADESVLMVNPAKGLRMPRTGNRPPKYCSMDDFVRLMAATDGDSPVQIRDRALLLMLADTGCRVGGLARLRLHDVDLVRCLVSLHEKGDRKRVVPFSVVTSEAIKNWLQVRPAVSEDWLFVNLGTRIIQCRLTEDAVGEVLRRLKKRAQVTGRVNPHSFRHSFAREWLRAGGDLATLSSMLGHTDPGITLRFYARFQTDELHEFHEQFSPVVRLYGTEKNQVQSELDA